MALSGTDRIIILVDMDCFYCQVEEKLNPKLKGKPVAVVQYNQWRGGGIIAVNYEARDRGVTRHMRGGEAREKCPSIELVSVPTKRGKADTSRYRDAGKRVAEVLLTFTPSLERASVDEAYLDVTAHVNERINTAQDRITKRHIQNTHVVGFNNIQHFLEEVYDTELSNDVMLRLAMGAAMAEEIRAAVFAKTGYRCSAGVAHNKILAKLVCGLHKPNQQTVLPQEGLSELYEKMPVRKIQSMGGKFGTNVTDTLNIEYMGELVKFSENELRQHFDEKTSQWLYQLARGIENTPVTVRLRSQSIGCCKKFPGPSALCCMSELRPWVEHLVADLHERLAEDRVECGRRARHLIISMTYVPADILKEGRKVVRKEEVSQSRSIAMVADWDIGDGTRTIDEFLNILKKSGGFPSIIQDEESKVFSFRYLGLSAGKFEDIQTNQTSISSFLIAKSKDITKFVDDSVILENSLGNNMNTITQLQEKSKNNFDIEENIEKDTAMNQNNVLVKSHETTLKYNIPQSYPKPSKSNSKKTDSFFLNYFRSIEQEPVAGTSSNFKTNKSLNDATLAQETLIAANEEPLQQVDDNLTTICSECRKAIALENVQSHSDYHFAIKLVKEEFHIYKNVTPKQNSVQKVGEKLKKTSRKRKSSEAMNCKSIDSFFVSKKVKLDNTDSKECDECHMFISETDFEMHKDFHVAKKLSTEINADVKLQNNVNIGENITAMKKNRKAKCDTKSIRTYFKPT